MKRAVFFDTNVFVYADDAAFPAKKQRSIEVIGEYQQKGLATISVQVMQEYFSIATKKLRIDGGTAQRKVELMGEMRVVRFRPEDVVDAIELHRLHLISFWDALVVRAAQLGGAEVLYSEDMQDGMQFGGVTVVNPYR